VLVRIAMDVRTSAVILGRRAPGLEPGTAVVDNRARLDVNGAVDGIHDLGGMQGFGRVVAAPGEPVFHAPWEGRVFALAGVLVARGIVTVDAFRHAIERLPPAVYLTAGYYGRWLAALERLVVEKGIAAGAPPPAGTRAPGARREVARPPRFAAGDRVVAADVHPTGHTRLPRYVRGRRGVVARVHPAFVFPDTNAHGLGEHPQHVYAVRFAARELWGEEADARAVVHVDVFESHLGPAA
jgi:nitrile hydratase